jgi:hypothetical protein
MAELSADYVQAAIRAAALKVRSRRAARRKPVTCPK